jgi:hypothetical protein
LHAPHQTADGEIACDRFIVPIEEGAEPKKVKARLYAATRKANQSAAGEGRRYRCVTSGDSIAVYRIDSLLEARPSVA